MARCSSREMDRAMTWRSCRCSLVRCHRVQKAPPNTRFLSLPIAFLTILRCERCSSACCFQEDRAPHKKRLVNLATAFATEARCWICCRACALQTSQALASPRCFILEIVLFVVLRAFTCSDTTSFHFLKARAAAKWTTPAPTCSAFSFCHTSSLVQSLHVSIALLKRAFCHLDAARPTIISWRLNSPAFSTHAFQHLASSRASSRAPALSPICLIRFSSQVWSTHLRNDLMAALFLIRVIHL